MSTTKMYTNQFHAKNETLLQENNIHEMNIQTCIEEEQPCTSKSSLEIINKNIKQIDNCKEISSKKERKKQHNIPIRRPRIGNPRYLGDIKEWNLENPERLKQYLALTTKQITNLKQRKSTLKKNLKDTRKR